MDYGELNIDNFNEVGIHRVNNGAQSTQNREAKIKNEEFGMWRSDMKTTQWSIESGERSLKYRGGLCCIENE